MSVLMSRGVDINMFLIAVLIIAHMSVFVSGWFDIESMVSVCYNIGIRSRGEKDRKQKYLPSTLGNCESQN